MFCVSFFDDGITITKTRHAGTVGRPAVLGCRPYWIPSGISLDYHIKTFMGVNDLDELVEMLIIKLDAMSRHDFGTNTSAAKELPDG